MLLSKLIVFDHCVVRKKKLYCFIAIVHSIVLSVFQLFCCLLSYLLLFSLFIQSVVQYELLVLLFCQNYYLSIFNIIFVALVIIVSYNLCVVS